MYVKQIRDAAHTSLREHGHNAVKLTLFFMLAVHLVVTPCEIFSMIFQEQTLSAEDFAFSDMASRYNIYAIIMSILLTFYEGLFDVGYFSFSLSVARGKETTFDDMLSGFRAWGRFILLYIIKSAYIILWSMLFVIPGIIAAYRYKFAEMILLDNPEMTPLQALQASKELTAGKKINLFTLDLSFLLHHAIVFFLTNYELMLAQFEVEFVSLKQSIYAISIAAAMLIVIETLLRPKLYVCYAQAYCHALSPDAEPEPC